MGYETKTISNVAEFVDYVTSENSYYQKLDGRNNRLLFRGQSNCENVLLPSIGRNSAEMISEPLLREEGNMIEMAKYKLPELFTSAMQPIDLLALLQHHGIPTRLLDISENALVALYFACLNENIKDKTADGEVLLFDHKCPSVENFPINNAIADSYHFIRKDKLSLTDFCREISKQSYFLEQSYLLDEDFDVERDGAKWIHECCDEIMIIYAKSYGLRQRIQRGRYILFPNTIYKDADGTEYFGQSITPIDKNHKAIVGRCLIPADKKEQILNDLRILGISREMLFMDNSDIICKEIADQIKSRTTD